jgi:hypothetical protein
MREIRSDGCRMREQRYASAAQVSAQRGLRA